MNDSDLRKETRFSVVMYGGVSLAVYINGIAQELYRMVSSTADKPSASKQELSCGTEKVYKKLGEILKTRFVVDIISGTSAGGINGIFLAKALANGQSIKPLEQLWLDEGNIEVLINDKKSKDSECKADVQYPRSLLNSERMYNQLLKAFQDMETTSTRKTLVDELDLYVTATDLQGLPVTIKLSDIVVSEKDHRNTFHFHFNKDIEDDNDFIKDNNPFLAFAARCTSAFPFAFEPIRLKDIQLKKNSSQWKKFYEKYLFDPSHFVNQKKPNNVDMVDNKYDLFTGRSFADGGYLDNKPFSYAINCIKSRSSRIPIDRKLIYIEPSPDEMPDPCDIDKAPNAIENIGKVFSLAIYETIREDLQGVIDRNRLIERVNRILKGTTEDFLLKKVNPSTAIDWNRSYLKEMIGKEGFSYGGYLRLRAAQLTDDLTEIITRLLGFDVKSDFFLAVRYIVRVWRDAKYQYDLKEGAGPDNKVTFNQFLYDFDLLFMIRRLGYTISVIDSVLPLVEILTQKIVKDELSTEASRKEFFTSIQSEYGVLFRRVVEPMISGVKVEILDNLSKFIERLCDERKEISSRREAIYDLQQMLFEPGKLKKLPVEIEDLLSTILSINIGPEQMIEKILTYSSEDKKHTGALSEKESYEAAKRIIDEYNLTDKLDRIADIIKKVVSKADRHTSLAKVKLGLGSVYKINDIERNDDYYKKELEELLKSGSFDLVTIKSYKLKNLDIPVSVEDLLNDEKLKSQNVFSHWAMMSLPDRLATWICGFFFRRFMWYDEIAYPIIQFSGVGNELDEVEIFRISPNDAKSLSNFGVRKLGGTTLMHFGAFLNRTWRKNDILWGRLDGAERIIRAVMTGKEEETITNLIKEAHLAIIEETFFEPGVDDPACPGRLRVQETIDFLMQMAFGKNNSDRRINFDKISAGGKKDLQKFAADLLAQAISGRIDAKEIYSWLIDYKVDKDINPRLALEAISRSTQVVGKMLGVMSDQYRELKGPARWITLMGEYAWVFVEAAVPRSFLDLLTRKLSSLITMIAAILIAGGIFFKDNTVERIGIWLLVGVFCFTLIKFLLRKILIKGRLPSIIKQMIIFLPALAIFAIMGVGFWYLPDAFNRLLVIMKHCFHIY